MTTIFETDRLVVREWRREEAEAAFCIYGDPVVRKYLAGDADLRIEDSRARIDRFLSLYERFPGFGVWAVIERSTGDVIGAVLLLRLEKTEEYEIGYQFRQASWGQGYATEVARGAVVYAFDVVGLDRVVGVAFAENGASLRVLEKIGMIRDGNRTYWGYDLAYFALDKPAPTSSE
jgi:RimJ/RimL family protein N-acetyltransferase